MEVFLGGRYSATTAGGRGCLSTFGQVRLWRTLPGGGNFTIWQSYWHCIGKEEKHGDVLETALVLIQIFHYMRKKEIWTVWPICGGPIKMFVFRGNGRCAKHTST